MKDATILLTLVGGLAVGFFIVGSYISTLTGAF